jgi:hypothetical protein
MALGRGEEDTYSRRLERIPAILAVFSYLFWLLGV